MKGAGQDILVLDPGDPATRPCPSACTASSPTRIHGVRGTHPCVGRHSLASSLDAAHSLPRSRLNPITEAAEARGGKHGQSARGQRTPQRASAQPAPSPGTAQRLQARMRQH